MWHRRPRHARLGAADGTKGSSEGVHEPLRRSPWEGGFFYEGLKALMWMEFEPLRECLRTARRYMAVAGCRDRLAAMAGRRLTVPDVEQELRRQLAHAQQSGLGLVDIRAGELHRDVKGEDRMPLVCHVMRKLMVSPDEVYRDRGAGKAQASSFAIGCPVPDDDGDEGPFEASTLPGLRQMAGGLPR
jgi:hypothetical protein